MTQQEQLHLKLKSLGVYEQFMANIDDSRYYNVSGAFLWSRTIEGNTFWSRIHSKVDKMKDIITKRLIGGEIL